MQSTSTSPMPTRFLLSIVASLAICACGTEDPTPETPRSDAVNDPFADVATDRSLDGEDARPDGVADTEVDAVADSDADACAPSCGDRECGDDGCGTPCGECDGGACVDGYCAPECTPACDGRECGDDGCEGSCGTCRPGDECHDGACDCMPACDGRDCGDDGCGGSCGDCEIDQFCSEGSCVADCIPSCDGLACGDDGCGGSCGDCSPGEGCVEGACECIPDCVGVSCGDDGCAGLCGECADGFGCEVGECVCEPDCDGLECGGDGCGGSCGECDTDCVDGMCTALAGCPPEGPFGTRAGQTLRDYTLLTCDGDEVSVHDLCGNEASLLLGFAGWCPPCNRNAPEWAAGYAARADESLGVYFVVNQNASFGSADEVYCSGIRDEFGLTMPVLYDPTGGFPTAMGMRANDSSVIIDGAFVVVESGQYRTPSSVWADIDELLEL